MPETRRRMVGCRASLPGSEGLFYPCGSLAGGSWTRFAPLERGGTWGSVECRVPSVSEPFECPIWVALGSGCGRLNRLINLLSLKTTPRAAVERLFSRESMPRRNPPPPAGPVIAGHKGRKGRGCAGSRLAGRSGREAKRAAAPGLGGSCGAQPRTHLRHEALDLSVSRSGA